MKEEKEVKLTLEEITAGVEEYRQLGATDEDITGLLKEFNYTPASYELALKNKSEKKDKGEGFWSDVGNYMFGDSKQIKMGGGQFAGSGLVRDVAHAQDTFTGGLSIYGRAGIASLRDKYSTGEWNWDQNLANTRGEIQEYMDESPVRAGVADATGGTMQALIPVGKVLQATKAGPFSPAGKPIRKVMKDMTVGGVTGGVTAGGQTLAVASARGEEDTGKQTILATALGGTTGGALPLFYPIAKGTSGAWKMFKDNPKVLETMDELGEGFEQIKAFFTKDGKVSENIQKEIKRQQALGLGDDMMAVDLIDEVGIEKAGSFLRLGDPNSETIRSIREALRTRLMNTKEKAVRFITSASGQVKKSIEKHKDYLSNKTRMESSPEYQSAYFRTDEAGNKVYNTITDPRIDDLFSRPDFMEAYTVAKKQALNSVDGRPLPKFPLEQRYRMVEDPNSDYFVDGLPMTFDRDQAGNLIPISNDPVKWPVWALDTAKKYLDRKYKYAHLPDAPPALKGIKGDITELKNTLVTIVDDAHPTYRRARVKYRSQAEQEEAFEQGTDFWKPALSGDDATYIHKQLNPVQRDSFRLGAYNSLMDWIERAGEGKNPRAVADYFKSDQNMKKLMWIVPDPKQRRRLLARLEVLGNRIYVDNVLLKNSATAARQAMDDDMSIGGAMQLSKDVQSRNLPAVATKVEQMITPETVKRKATSGAKFAFQSGSKNVDKNLKQAEGLLSKEAEKRAVYDPLNLLHFTSGGSATAGGYYDQRKRRKRQGE